MNQRGINFNRTYGHADDCKFGMENSGICSCGKGFVRKDSHQGTYVFTAICEDCGYQTCICEPLTAPIASRKPLTGDEWKEYLELATDIGGES